MQNRIRDLRQAARLSQSDLAARVGVSQQSLSAWETQTAQPPLDRAVALAVALGVTLDALAGRDGTGTELDAVLQRLRAELVRIGAGGPRS